MKILAGLSHKTLAKSLANDMNCEYVESYTTTFEDGETRVQILDDLNGCDVAIMQSTSKPANNHLIELLLLVDTAKRSGAKRIIVVMPYFGYSRQDRRSYLFSPISARLIANLLEVAGIDHLITIDLHSNQLEGFFKIVVQNLNPINLFASLLSSYSNSIIVSPDIGGFIRAKTINNMFNRDIAVINKSRDKDNKYNMSEVIGNVVGKHCLLIDDIVDSGQTLCKGAKLLMDMGALSVNAFVTHPVLSGTAKEEIENSSITNIYVTDTIEIKDLTPKFHVISIMPIIITALERIRN